MNELTNKGFIPKKDKGSGPYQELYLEGIELLQQLASDEWTDYNEHDPGVTILENLSYTLSDLSNRSQLPINDLLTEGKGQPLESGDNGFFIPSEILTTSPVTISDFRKLLIDSVTNVKNVWLQSLGNEQSKKANHLRGLYQVFVEVYRYEDSPNERNKESKRIEKAISDLFHANRNLCEDLYRVRILKPFTLKTKFNLSIKPDFEGEDIYAQVFYRINDYLSHDVRFNSLWDLEDEKMDVGDIFDGPKLENGFITDGELKDQLPVISISSIIGIMSQIEGVISVDHFELFYLEDNLETKNFTMLAQGARSIKVPWGCTPRLLFPNSEKDILLKNGNITFHPNLKKTEKQLSYIEAMNYGSFKSVSQSLNEIEIPEGESSQAGTYFTIRNQFPLVYGIGEYGLPPRLPEKRYAQANQLKTYLLPFDQLMTNHLAQLTHIYDLYDTNDSKFQSYCGQDLEDLPKLLDFYRFPSTDLAKDKEKNKLENWKQEFSKLNTQFDSKAIKRLNQVADHLLARFGEEFPSYALRKINEVSFGKNTTDETFDKQLLLWKRNFIANYDKISYNRTKAAYASNEVSISKNGSVKDLNNHLVAGLVKKISMLMGIVDCSIRPLASVVKNSGFTIYHKREDMIVMSDKLDLGTNEDDLAAIALDNVVIIDDKVENLRDDFYFIGNSKNILEDTLSQGSNKENYEIIKTDRGQNNDYYVLLNKDNGRKSVVHVTLENQDAKAAINYAANFLSGLCQQSEGMYLLEHVQLAPPYHSKQFGFTFKINLSNASCTELEFAQIELQSTGKRNWNIRNILGGISKNDFSNNEGYQFRAIAVEGEFVIQIMTSEGKQMAQTTSGYKLESEAIEHIELLKNTLLYTELKQLQDTVKNYAYFGKNEKVSEDFFSYRMSFILPSWPTRFQNKNFRAKFENLVYEEGPIHVASESHWLNIDKMATFEEDYYEWLTYKLNEPESKAQLHKSYDLITKILEYEKVDELETIR